MWFFDCGWRFLQMIQLTLCSIKGRILYQHTSNRERPIYDVDQREVYAVHFAQVGDCFGIVGKSRHGD